MAHEDMAVASGLSVTQYVALVVAGVAVLQALWIAVVPPFRGSDEFDHAYRAAGVSAGQWRASEEVEDGRGLLVEAPESLVRAAHDQCAALDYTGPDNCSPVEDLGDGQVLVGSGAGGYHPGFYWVVGEIGAPFTGATALYAMRVVSALLCLLFVGLAAWAVAVRPAARWSRFGLVFAMPPVMLYSTAIVASNGLEMAAALAFWSALLGLDGALDVRRERWLLAIAALSAAVLMIDRTLGPLFALAILLTVWLLHPDLVRGTIRRHTAPFVAWAVVVVLCAGWAAVWLLAGSAGPGDSVREGGDWSWSALVLWPMQSIAAFPLRGQTAAPIVYPVVLLAFLALMTVALRVGRGRERLALVVALGLSLALPLVLTALTYEGRGVIWQGRYGLPFALGTVLLATTVMDRRDWSTRLRPALLLIATSLLAVSTAACYAKVLDLELARPPSTGDPAWHAPDVTLLVGLTLLAWLLLHRAYAREVVVRV